MPGAIPEEVGSIRESLKPVSAEELRALDALMRAAGCRGSLVKLDRTGDGFSAGHCILGFLPEDGYTLRYPVGEMLFELFTTWESARELM